MTTFSDVPLLPEIFGHVKTQTMQTADRTDGGFFLMYNFVY